MDSKSKWGLDICPEVCADCKDGKHAMHVIDELGELHVFVVSKQIAKRMCYSYTIHGSTEQSPDNFWLKHLLEQAAKSIKG